MKKSFLKPTRAGLTIGIVLFCWFGSRAQPVEDALHFGGGAVVGAAGSFMASELSVESPVRRISWAVGASLVAGLLKEAVDEYRYNGWNNRDLAFTVLGGLTAGVTIELFKTSKSGRAKQMISILDSQNQEINNIQGTITKPWKTE